MSDIFPEGAKVWWVSPPPSSCPTGPFRLHEWIMKQRARDGVVQGSFVDAVLSVTEYPYSAVRSFAGEAVALVPEALVARVEALEAAGEIVIPPYWRDGAIVRWPFAA